MRIYKRSLQQTALAILLLCGGLHGASRAADPAKVPMSFFVTSVGIGTGGDLSGLAGADAHCQSLAQAEGRGESTWKAYLSTQGKGAIHARDRIGTGPWYNANGRMIARNLGELHGDILAQAQLGAPISRAFALTERGEIVPGYGENLNRHDMLTGSLPDGRAFAGDEDRTCSNWTSQTSGHAQLGHHDRQGGGNASWNSAHTSRSCSQPDLVATGGAGLFYCFVADPQAGAEQKSPSSR